MSVAPTKPGKCRHLGAKFCAFIGKKNIFSEQLFLAPGKNCEEELRHKEEVSHVEDP